MSYRQYKVETAPFACDNALSAHNLESADGFQLELHKAESSFPTMPCQPNVRQADIDRGPPCSCLCVHVCACAHVKTKCVHWADPFEYPYSFVTSMTDV